MTPEAVVAVAVPTGVVIGWLAKLFQDRKGNGTGTHELFEQKALNAWSAIARNTDCLPILMEKIEQHERDEARLRGQVSEIHSDVVARQRRGE